MAESRALGDEEKALDARGRPARRRSCASCCCARPNLPSDDCPDGAGEQDNVVLRTEGYDPDAYGDAPAGAALGHRRRARHPRRRAGRQDRRLDVHALPGLGRPAAAGDGAAEPRPQRRRLRGAPAAHPRAHRHDDRHRPPPEVRGRGVPHGARRPLGHPHRRGAAHVAAPRRGARRGRPAAPLHRPHVVLPARGGRGRARHARAAARARVRQGRAARGGQRTPSRPSPARRTSSPAARRCSPSSGLPYRVLDLCTGDVGASAARTWDLEAYAPGLRHVARGELGVVVQRLPGAAGQHPLPAHRRQGHRGVPHRERLGDGLAAHRRRLPRDAPPARRLDRDREAAAGLPRASRPSPAAR